MNQVVTLDQDQEVVTRLDQGTAMVAMIERVAMDPQLPIEKLEQMLSLQERIWQREARQAFNNAIANARANIPPIIKSAEVDFTHNGKRTNYKHETLDGIAKVVDPILAENGLSYRFRSQQQNGILHVTCIVAHRGGYSEETTLCGSPDTSGSKNGYQSIGSAATYLQRYTLKLALGLSAAHDDDARGANEKGEGGDPKTNEAEQRYQERCAAAERSIGNEKTLESLAAYWSSLARDEPGVARCKQIVEAKDRRKAELSRAQNADIGSDEIPY